VFRWSNIYSLTKKPPFWVVFLYLLIIVSLALIIRLYYYNKYVRKYKEK